MPLMRPHGNLFWSRWWTSKDLGNAIAINSSLNNSARLIGPAIVGLVIGMFGEGWCFLIDGFGYFAVIALLLRMQLRLVATNPPKASMFEQMREGWEYVRTFQPIRSILLLFFSLASWGGLMACCFRSLPIFAGHVLHGGPYTLGWLTGASGVGALVSALSLAARKSVVGLPRIIQLPAALFGVGLMLFGLSHTLWFSLLLMGVVGFGMIQCASASNTVIQSLVPEDKRGRVMAYYVMAFVGAAPLGSLLAGGLAHWMGAPAAVITTGAFCVAGSL